MAIRKSTGIFHFTWLQQNLCCERPTRPTDIADYFLSPMVIGGIYVILPTFYCSSGLLILSAPSKSQHDRQSLFVCFSVNYFKYNVCSLTPLHTQPKLIFHFPIRFPPRLGHSTMITHFSCRVLKKSLPGLCGKWVI